MIDCYRNRVSEKRLAENARAAADRESIVIERVGFWGKFRRIRWGLFFLYSILGLWLTRAFFHKFSADHAVILLSFFILTAAYNFARKLQQLEEIASLQVINYLLPVPQKLYQKRIYLQAIPTFLFWFSITCLVLYFYQNHGITVYPLRIGLSALGLFGISYFVSEYGGRFIRGLLDFALVTLLIILLIVEEDSSNVILQGFIENYRHLPWHLALTSSPFAWSATWQVLGFGLLAFAFLTYRHAFRFVIHPHLFFELFGATDTLDDLETEEIENADSLPAETDLADLKSEFHSLSIKPVGHLENLMWRGLDEKQRVLAAAFGLTRLRLLTVFLKICGLLFLTLVAHQLLQNWDFGLANILLMIFQGTLFLAMIYKGNFADNYLGVVSVPPNALVPTVAYLPVGLENVRRIAFCEYRCKLPIVAFITNFFAHATYAILLGSHQKTFEPSQIG